MFVRETRFTAEEITEGFVATKKSPVTDWVWFRVSNQIYKTLAKNNSEAVENNREPMSEELAIFRRMGMLESKTMAK